MTKPAASTGNLPQYVSTGKATRTLGVCRQTLVKYAKDGLIEGHQTPGGKWRFNVAEYLARRAKKAENAKEPQDGLPPPS